MSSRLPINTAPRDGTLIRLLCRSEAEPIVGYWSKTFIGWVAYHEAIPLIRHDVTGWEPIVDQAAARAVPRQAAWHSALQISSRPLGWLRGKARPSREGLVIGRHMNCQCGRTRPVVQNPTAENCSE